MSVSTLDTLESLSGQDTQSNPFGPYEEEAIVSLALDHPEFFQAAARFMKPTMFVNVSVQYVMAEILNDYEKFNVVPTREMLRSKLRKNMSVDDPFEEVYRVIARKSDPREIPMVKDTLLKWSKDRAYGLLYSDEAIEAYHRQDYAFIEGIVNEANRIADVGNTGFWFFENAEMLFQDDVIQHKTTGFPRLDKMLNNGGPGKKEVVCWLAGTNVGKSVLLCNNAISSLKGEGSDGKPGADVLLITFELDAIKTAMRCVASAFGVPINQIADKQDYIRRLMQQMQKTYNRRFLIHEMPPDECSVNHIYMLLDNLKRIHGWKPEVIIIDYMDLMVSRNPSYNKDDYTRQKHVANEVRGLAKNEEVLIFTATQTNRSGSNGEELVDLTKAAESFGKQFSLDYIISLNQTQIERSMTPPQLRFYIAKNRNGPKNELISCEINYDTMAVRELL